MNGETHPLPLPATAPQPKPMNELSRLAGVFFSPGAAFADIARRPRWWVPILILGITGIITTYIFSQQVGFDVAIRQAFDRNPQALQLTPEQRARAITIQTNIVRYIAYGNVVFLAMVYAIVAAVFKFLFDVLQGADIGFKRMMAIVCYAALPQVLVSILTIVVIYTKPAADIDFQNPLAFNVAAYLPTTAPGWLRGMGGALDLFSFWIIGLLGIGVSQAARKISTGKAIATILFPWLLWVAVRAALGALQG